MSLEGSVDATDALAGLQSFRENGPISTRLISAIPFLGTQMCLPGQQHEVVDQDCAFDRLLGGSERTTTVHHQCGRALGTIVDPRNPGVGVLHLQFALTSSICRRTAASRAGDHASFWHPSGWPPQRCVYLTQFHLDSGRCYLLGGYNSNSQMVGPSVASVMFRRTRWAVIGGNVASSVAPRSWPW